jgi:hypothetical protein
MYTIPKKSKLGGKYGTKIELNYSNIYSIDKQPVTPEIPVDSTGTNALPESEPYDADFRTVTGTEIHDHFDVSFYPGGIINQTKYSGLWTLPYTMWQEAIDEIINLLPEVYITIENDYDPSNRKLISTVTAEFLTDMEGTYNLCFYIAESGIIAAQKNDNSNYGHVPDILDYEHHHVLRTSVWGAWGTEVVSAGISQGETVTEYPSVTINNNWVADNCTVIAFIYNTETYNIIQAEEAAMIE